MDPEDLDLNDPFVAQCKDVFDSLDLDKNGMITPYILGQAFKKYGWKTIQPYELVVRWNITILRLWFCNKSGPGSFKFMYLSAKVSGNIIYFRKW